MDNLRTPSLQHFEPAERNFEHVDWCLQKADEMLGYWRKGEANNPKAYGLAVAAMLAEYPPDVVEELTHPLRGMPSRTDFMPTLRELREACEQESERNQRINDLGKYQRRPIKYEKPRAPAPSHEELMKTHGRFLGPFESPGDKWNKWGGSTTDRQFVYGGRPDAKMEGA
jgi:hypothetical protein